MGRGVVECILHGVSGEVCWAVGGGEGNCGERCREVCWGMEKVRKDVWGVKKSVDRWRCVGECMG